MTARLRGRHDREKARKGNGRRQSRNETRALEHAPIIGKLASGLAGPPAVAPA
jgi:hypothetical protein